MMKRYNTIYFYLIKEMIITFIVNFAFFFFIFFINQILLIAEKILAEKVPIIDVLTLLVYYLPLVITTAFPFSALVAALMAVGRLSADNEILAMRASGISLIQAFLPLFLISIALSGVAFVINDYLVPLSIIKSSAYYREVITKNPVLEFEPYTVKKFNDILITNGEVVGNNIRDLVIIDKTTKNDKRIITAKDAYLLKNKKQEGVISLELNNVFSHIASNNIRGNYEYSHAEKMIYNILINDVVGSSISVDSGPKAMTSVDLWKIIKEKNIKLRESMEIQKERIALAYYELVMQSEYALALDNTQRITERTDDIRRAYDIYEKEKKVVITDRPLRVYLLEFHRKFAHPFSCIVFILFAFPVGMFARKSGRSVGFAIGVIMSGFYWSSQFIFYRLGAQVEYSSFLMMWMPNFIVLAIGLVIFAVRLKA